jgi:hypothetical protein
MNFSLSTMTNPMTPQAQIEYLITEILRKKIFEPTEEGFVTDGNFTKVVALGKTTYLYWNGKKDVIWNPLVSWDDWRSVEEKVMEDEKLFTEWVWTIATPGKNARPVSMEVCEADLPTRCKALIAAHQELAL